MKDGDNPGVVAFPPLIFAIFAAVGIGIDFLQGNWIRGTPFGCDHGANQFTFCCQLQLAGLEPDCQPAILASHAP